MIRPRNVDQRQDGMSEIHADTVSEAVQARQRLVAAVMDQVGAQLACWSRDLVCLFANEAYAESLGRSAAELLGQPMQELVGVARLREDQARIEAVLRGRPQRFERSLARPDGSFGYTSTRYLPDHDDDRIRGFFDLTVDITPLKNSDASLAKSEARLVRAELGTKSGNWELHLASQTISGSVGATRIYGVHKEQFDLATVQRMVLPDYRAKLDASLRGLIEGDAPYDVEFKIKTESTGQIKDIHSIAVLDRAGGVVFGMIQDVTDRKASQLALVESEARFRNMFEGNGSIMLLVDPTSGEIGAANAAAAHYYGYPLTRLIGMNMSQINALAPGDVTRECARALQEGRNYFNLAHRTASGELRDTEVYSTPIVVAGKTLLLSIVHDTTARKRAEQALLESEAFFHATIDAVTEHLCVLDEVGSILAVNQAWRDFYDQNCAHLEPGEHRYGIASDYLRVCDLATGPGAEEARLAAEGIRQVIRGDRETFSLEYPCHSPTQRRWFQLTVTRFGVDSPRVVVAHQNITSFVENEARLKLAASVFAHAREGITITDADGRIVEVNKTFTDVTGYSREELLGRNSSLLKSDRQTPEFYVAMWNELLTKGHWSGELWNQRKNGEVYAALLTISAVKDAADKTQSYVALFTDITAIKEHARQLEHIAHYDPLTNLPNRVLLADRLEQGMVQTQRRGQLLAVAYLDLDGFKAVNDQYGHEVGDELLVAVAARMKTALREGDTLARIGGDEFAAVLLDLDAARDCEPVLNRLLHAAAERVTVAGKALQVSVSIGVTIFPQDATDAEHLMRHADQAMYLAKQSGRNRYHLFDVAHHHAVETRRESLEHIRGALDRREFVLYYQPKVNMRTGEIIGVEALIRWQHAERGLLPPAAFLPVIEDHPMSLELGDWVIARALAQVTDWQAAGLAMPVSVNVGAYQLQHDGFVSRLAALLAANPQVQPAWLELEVLETSALNDVAKVSQLMHECRALGVRFAVDDFGTGYSTLTYLKMLPAELLKIDQSFVRDMLADADNLAIVEGVIGLAKAFRRQVIAEGVETVAHGAMLLQLGCELAQGYGIARPMPASAVADWAATWRPDGDWTGRRAD
jgi:diguanylate cyclase (GGDEF)-like protein/PAS domain S-box-containing protein